MDTMNTIEKVVVNVGVGKASGRPEFKEKILPEIKKELAQITGQKPKTCPARQSVAGFKTRKGDVVGLAVTLRSKRMRDFLKRLTSVVLPRVKDFRGLELKNVDENGNLNIGIRDHFVFPEIGQNISKVNFGLQITAVSRLQKRREQMIQNYKSVGFLFKEKVVKKTARS